MNQQEQVLGALRRVIHATDLHSRHLAKTTGLTTPQMLLLRAIRDRGELTVGELASEISLSQATVTNILDRLEKRGLMQRRRSQLDKRRVHACLTAPGRDLLDSAPAPLQTRFAERYSALQDWEQHMILAAFQRVADMMDAPDISSAQLLDSALVEVAEAGDNCEAESSKRV